MNNSKFVPTRRLVLSAEQLAFLTQGASQTESSDRQEKYSATKSTTVVELDFLDNVSRKQANSEQSYVLGYN